VTPQIRFLTADEVVELHEDQIRRYGGASGLRDISLLESAVAQPTATFEGRDLHPDLIDKAAAYAFHLCRDHPFVDGNKRVALASALVFLELNGMDVTDRRGALYNLMVEVASGRAGKPEIVEVFRRLRT
jgi:death on curing protein